MKKIRRIDKRIKLMHVVFTLDTGGLEKLVVELVNRINKDVFISSVCCLTKEGSLSRELDKRGVNIFYFYKKEGIDYFLLFRLAKLFRKEKINIMHTHDSSANLYGGIAARMAGVKTIINTEHGGIYFESKRKQFINKYLALFNNKVVCVSSSIRNDLEGMGVFNGRLKVIPNGIDLERFNFNLDINQKRAELGLNHSDFIICAVGRLSREKNQKMLLDSTRYILERIPEAKILIIGDGPLRKYLEDYAQNAGIQDKVKFLGTREDVPELLKISDCFVACSDYESFGLAVLEAMVAGIPVVTTNAGGLGEIVKDNETGVIIPKNDIEALTLAILHIKNECLFSKKLVSQANAWMKANYNIERMVKDYENLYLDCIKKLPIKNESFISYKSVTLSS